MRRRRGQDRAIGSEHDQSYIQAWKYNETHYSIKLVVIMIK
jgi:hypothetical protein